MIVPDDIIYVIFDLLSEEKDTRSLLRCSSLSHRFRYRCQRLAYRELTLSTRCNSGRLLPLERAIASNAPLGSFVEKLDLILTDPDADTDHLTISLLSRLTNLRSFDLAFKSRHMYFDWFDMLDPLRAALARIILSPQLSALSLSRVSLPLAQFLQCGLTNIQDLRLLAVQTDERFDEVIEASTTPLDLSHLLIRPRKLALNPSQRSTLLDSQRLDWSSVHSLRISRGWTLHMAGRAVVQACADFLPKTPQLRSLELGGPYDAINNCELNTIFNHSVDPQLYGTLTQTRVYINWAGQDLRSMANKDPYLGLFESFSTFPLSNALESIYLQISISLTNAFPMFATVSDLIVPTKWTRISSIFTSSAFPSLKRHGIHLHIIISLPPLSLDGIAEAIRDMPWGELQASERLLLEIKTVP